MLGAQHRDATQQQSRVEYRIDDAAAAAAGNAPAPPSAHGERLASFLQSPSSSVLAALLALGFAALLGALHALTPGHAKTLMAAHLIGTGGTTRNALTLGAVVTFTHTASVIAIGLIALFASQFLVPGVLVPSLETISGILVLAIGLQLLRHRWSSAKTRPAGIPQARVHNDVWKPALVVAERGHDHAHPVGHSHDHHHRHDADDAHVHTRSGRPHTQALPAGGITARNLVAMGVSGGLVPCLEALGVMVLAVGVNRTGFGLGLIVSFSLGLAAVLMCLGIVLVRLRHLITRIERLGTRWTTILPLISAVVVTALGVGLLVKGVGSVSFRQ